MVTLSFVTTFSRGHFGFFLSQSLFSTCCAVIASRLNLNKLNPINSAKRLRKVAINIHSRLVTFLPPFPFFVFFIVRVAYHFRRFIKTDS
jgi:arginyl-tRNA--protein-N-Asp/Glu arginylyltransferase